MSILNIECPLNPRTRKLFKHINNLFSFRIVYDLLYKCYLILLRYFIIIIFPNLLLTYSGLCK